MQYTVNLAPGVRTPVEVAGRLAQIIGITGATQVEIAILRGMQEVERIRTAERGFKAVMPPELGQFSRVELVSNAAATVELVISDGGLEVQTNDGARVRVENVVGSPVSVRTHEAYSAARTATVAVGTTETQIGIHLYPELPPYDFTFKRVEWRAINRGAQPVALFPTRGPGGIPAPAWADAQVILQPGDMWVETRLANINCVALTQTGTSSLVITEIWDQV